MGESAGGAAGRSASPTISIDSDVALAPEHAGAPVAAAAATAATRDDGRPSCELCEAARLTEWYHEDDLCWVAECEACFVPMVVWKRHDPNPPEEVRVALHSVLSDVAGRVLASGFWIDDHLRSIPDHYHAHARRRFG